MITPDVSKVQVYFSGRLVLLHTLVADSITLRWYSLHHGFGFLIFVSIVTQESVRFEFWCRRMTSKEATEPPRRNIYQVITNLSLNYFFSNYCNKWTPPIILVMLKVVSQVLLKCLRSKLLHKNVWRSFRCIKQFCTKMSWLSSYHFMFLNVYHELCRSS